MKKLLSILGSVGMIGTAGATVVACGNGKKNLEENFKQKLTDKIQNTEKQKEQIETDFKSTGWGGENIEIPLKVRTNLEEAIAEAKTTSEAENLTREQAEAVETTLNEALTTYSAAMPQNIIAEVINSRQEDIKGLFSRNWTYSQFWNMNSEKNRDHRTRILDFLHEESEAIATSRGYESSDINWLRHNTSMYIQKFIDLVYIDIDENGNQQVVGRINGDRNSTETLEKLFLDQVKFHHYDQVDKDGNLPTDFFTKEENSKLSLGIQFPQNIEEFPFPEGTKSFWTFTLADELSKEAVENLFNANEEQDVIFNIQKGLDKWEEYRETFKKEFKKFISQKIYLPENIFLEFTEAPNDEQIKNGVEWKAKGTPIRFWLGDPKEGGQLQFEVNVKYTISIK